MLSTCMCDGDILTTVYGSGYQERIFKIMNNQELRELYNISDFVAHNKRRRLEWLVNMPNMEQEKTC